MLQFNIWQYTVPGFCTLDVVCIQGFLTSWVLCKLPAQFICNYKEYTVFVKQNLSKTVNLLAMCGIPINSYLSILVQNVLFTVFSRRYLFYFTRSEILVYINHIWFALHNHKTTWLKLYCLTFKTTHWLRKYLWDKMGIKSFICACHSGSCLVSESLLGWPAVVAHRSLTEYPLIVLSVKMKKTLLIFSVYFTSYLNT